jgi:hypothetical protein
VRLILIISISFSLIFCSCKSNEEKLVNPFANSIVKTTNNDSISIIGEWRLTARKCESQYIFINQGMLVKFKFNHILEVSPSEFYIWKLDNNVLKVYCPFNIQEKSFYDSMYVQIKKDYGYYSMILTDVTSNNQQFLSRNY